MYGLSALDDWNEVVNIFYIQKEKITMAKINLTGDAVVITSTLKTTEIESLMKYAPKALAAFETDEDNKAKEVFRVAVSPNGGINNYGVAFSGTSRDGNGFATLTIPFSGSANAEEAKKQIAEKYGQAIAYLNGIEAAAPAALKKVKDAEKAIVDAITVG